MALEFVFSYPSQELELILNFSNFFPELYSKSHQEWSILPPDALVHAYHPSPGLYCRGPTGDSLTAISVLTSTPGLLKLSYAYKSMGGWEWGEVGWKILK